MAVDAHRVPGSPGNPQAEQGRQIECCVPGSPEPPVRGGTTLDALAALGLGAKQFSESWKREWAGLMWAPAGAKRPGGFAVGLVGVGPARKGAVGISPMLDISEGGTRLWVDVRAGGVLGRGKARSLVQGGVTLEFGRGFEAHPYVQAGFVESGLGLQYDIRNKALYLTKTIKF